MRAFMVVPSRSADSVPLLVGGVLALVMLSVFVGRRRDDQVRPLNRAAGPPNRLACERD